MTGVQTCALPIFPIYSDEIIDDLQYKGLKLIQKKNGFRFGVDAVLLADFADVRKTDRVIDLGTGTGIIAVLLAGKSGAASVTGLEIQPDIAEMAQRSVKLNALEDRVKIINGDLRECAGYLGTAGFNVVVTNPPYMNLGGGLLNPSDTKAVSRHEIMCNLDDIATVSSRLLLPGGLFFMVHRPDRLVDVVYHMRCRGIEPKYIRFVHPSPYKKANLMLIKGMKGGRPQLKMLEPLYIYDENGAYSKEINQIYGREVEDFE